MWVEGGGETFFLEEGATFFWARTNARAHKKQSHEANVTAHTKNQSYLMVNVRPVLPDSVRSPWEVGSCMLLIYDQL